MPMNENSKKNLPVSSGPSNRAMNIEDKALTQALIRFEKNL